MIRPRALSFRAVQKILQTKLITMRVSNLKVKRQVRMHRTQIYRRDSNRLTQLESRRARGTQLRAPRGQERFGVKPSAGVASPGYARRAQVPACRRTRLDARRDGRHAVLAHPGLSHPPIWN